MKLKKIIDCFFSYLNLITKKKKKWEDVDSVISYLTIVYSEYRF